MSKQKKPQSKSRVVIISLIVVLALVIVSGLTYAIYKSNSAGTQAKEVEIAGTNYSDPKEYKDGKGIYISQKGVGELKDGVPTFEIYLDYVCGHCAHFEAEYAKTIDELVKDGKLNVIYRPVNILNDNYAKYVSSAMMDVINSKDKDKFPAFQEKYFENLVQLFETKDESKASTAYIDTIAKEAGVSDDVIAKFKNTANIDYTDTALQRWLKRDIFKGDQIGTPSFVLNGKKIELTEIKSPENFKKIIEETK